MTVRVGSARSRHHSTSFVSPTITPAEVQGPSGKRSNALVYVLLLALLAAAAIAWYFYTNRKPGAAATSAALTPITAPASPTESSPSAPARLLL